MAKNSPGFIKNYPLIPVKQGYYRVEDVEEFRRQAHNVYIESYNRSRELAENFRRVGNVLDEYQEGKNKIATTMMAAIAYSTESKEKADAKAKEIVDEATEKADALLEEKKAQADNYFAEKTKQGDEYCNKSKTAYEQVMADVKAKAQEYVAQINAQAEETVKKANETAALIVSRAYADAQKARKTADEIINSANEALPKAKNDLAKFKLDVAAVIENIQKQLSSIEVPEYVEFKSESSDDSQEEVKMDSETKFAYEVTEEPVEEKAEETAPVQSDVWEKPADEEEAADAYFKGSDKPKQEKSDIDVFSDSKNVPADSSDSADDSDEGETASDYLFDRFSSLQTNILGGDSPSDGSDDFSSIFNS